MCGVNVRILAALVCAAALGAASVASAQTLAIVPITSDASASSAERIRLAIVSELESATTWDVAPPEALPPQLRTADFQRCAGDSACFLELLGARFDDVLVVSLTRVEDHFTLGLRWVAAGDPMVLRATLLDGDDEASLIAGIPGALAAVFATRWRRLGAVHVVTAVPGTEVSAGDAVCLAPCTLRGLPEGQQAIEIRASGGALERRLVDVVAGRTAEVRIEGTAPSDSLWSGPWPWILGATVVVSVGVVTWALTRPGPRGICVHDLRVACPD